MNKNMIIEQLINRIYLIVLCFFIFFGYSTITFSEKNICIILGMLTLAFSMLKKSNVVFLTKSTKIFLMFVIFSFFSIIYTINLTATTYTLFLIIVCFLIKIFF